ncbi:helix-turn-helix transcriptional regulator [Sulfitobacter sp. F26169L]|uniref:helix-turn-helix domain-containing protein n=1 Tax=Sulfitobacter sp. F26169L TaxID=2996015 RepID=UPI002260976B|nr:helix-turn-helix transcriptional regulator [Sulfitobacter sp. F26169L]MCX7568065.1 helix-turn-helix transcriptional regulator [Sulfitobacter sp. F26169L]
MFNQFRSVVHKNSAGCVAELPLEICQFERCETWFLLEVAMTSVNHMIPFKRNMFEKDKSDHRRFPAAISAPEKISLAPREKDVLFWAAHGKSAWETSILLALSESTVKFYIRKACARLGAQNKTHAVALCLMHDLLDDYSSDPIPK